MRTKKVSWFTISGYVALGLYIGSALWTFGPEWFGWSTQRNEEDSVSGTLTQALEHGDMYAVAGRTFRTPVRACFAHADLDHIQRMTFDAQDPQQDWDTFLKEGKCIEVVQLRYTVVDVQYTDYKLRITIGDSKNTAHAERFLGVARIEAEGYPMLYMSVMLIKREAT